MRVKKKGLTFRVALTASHRNRPMARIAPRDCKEWAVRFSVSQKALGIASEYLVPGEA